jgi:hypothetical protein
MTDTPTAPTTPQAGDGGLPLPQAGATTPTPQAGSGKAPLTAEEYERKLAETNAEAAKYRVALKKYQDVEEARNQAALSDMEKANKRAADAEERTKHLQKQVVSGRVQLAALSKAAIDPELTALALESVLEYGDDGMPTNLEKALEDLAKNKPFLFKPADPTPTAAQSGQQKQAPTIPVMGGRGSIPSPTQGQSGKFQPPPWSDVFKKP